MAITGMLAYIIAGRELRFSTVHGKCLLLYYVCNVGKNGSFFKSTADIAAETKLSERFIRKANKSLREQGVLTWIQGSNWKRVANHYTLNLPELQKRALASQGAKDTSKVLARIKATERMRKHRANKRSAQTAQSDARDGTM